MASWLELASKHSTHSLPLMLLFVTHKRRAWNERCSEVFQRNKGCLPTTRIIQEALELAIEIEKSGSNKSRKEVAEAVTYLTSLGMVENQNHLHLETPHHGNLTTGNLLGPTSSRSSKALPGPTATNWTRPPTPVTQSQIGNSRQILEALFADDTGILLEASEENWRKTTEVVQQFETISGAKLNVAKSLAIPIGFEEPPGWLVRTGCKIANEGEVWSYLGCPIGVNITEEQILQFMLDRLTKRLQHWTLRLLSWESRVILTRHILLALPTYVLMVVGLTREGYGELKKVCRRFVWGTNREGTDKKALVAWEKLCKRKDEGGIGLVSFDTQTKTLKLRLVSQLMSDQELDWTLTAKVIIEWKVLSVQCRREEIGDTIQEILIMGKRLSLKETPTLDRILDGWWEIRHQLFLKQEALLSTWINASRLSSSAHGKGI
ncbi:hypothetical protein R1sor_011742 [Riccia sorocarpa]|uniref:Reverse transcriptase domain-containing protein n=1 Tax=Riccia sorocarpa TaxID=122646 RepID=A0ABD3I333_9MARC